MYEPLSPAEADRLAAEFSRTYRRWSRLEVMSAMATVLPGSLATSIAREVWHTHFHEPRDVGAAVRAVMTPWVYVEPPPIVTEVHEPQPPAATLPYDLPAIYDIEQCAYWLNFTVPELDWFTDHGQWLRTANPTLRHYRVRRIPKRDGVRIIEAPKPRLRETQRRLLSRVVQRIPAHSAARGFEPGSSVAAFAWPHTDRSVVLRIDLRHCFTSITSARVRREFLRVGYSPAIATVLSNLCTTATPVDELPGLDSFLAAALQRRHLPRGAPTSPHLANLVLAQLDRRIDGYAQAHDLRYTRYGDDIALSGDHLDVDAALWVLLRIIASEGFEVHAKKTRVMYRHHQQRLAGLVVNDAPRAPRADYDALRALLHNAIRYGAHSQNHEHTVDFRAYVYGRISWVGTSSRSRRDRLLAMASQIDWKR